MIALNAGIVPSVRAFGRLRQVKETGTGDLVAEYTYNGLGYRIGWHYDANTDGDVDGSDPWYRFVYDERWRIVATYRAGDADPKEQFVHHAAGDSGYGTASYIDDVILRDRDDNSGWTSSADGTLEERIYHCQNWRHDVVALIDATGDQVEMVRYSPYGVPFGLPAGDLDSDGDVDAADLTVFDALVAYDVRADLDLDGDNDATDRSTINANRGTSAGLGVLSQSAVASRKGYAGYAFAPELQDARSVYHVRYRVLDAELGRLLDRLPRMDPGSSFYVLESIASSLRIWRLTELPIAGAEMNSTHPRYQEGYRRGQWCLSDGATTWTDCMVCCASGIGHPDDPFGWGCRQACEEGAGPDIPPPPFMPECWDVEPLPPGPVCLSYGPCDTYMGANARCFCLCMGSDPWSDFVRACLACHYRRGEDSHAAHKDCYGEADRRFPQPVKRLAACAVLCWTYQWNICVFRAAEIAY